MKIYQNNILNVNKTIALYALLFMSFFDVPLRIYEGSPISIFRVLLIIAIFILIQKVKYVRWYLFFMVYILYQFYLTYMYCKCFNYYFAFSIHYLIILTIFMIMNYLFSKNDSHKIYLFIKISFYCILSILVIEITFNLKLFSTSLSIAQNTYSSVFWNVNEFGSAWICFYVLYLVYERNTIFKYAVSLFGFYALYINDVKMVFIAAILMTITYIFICIIKNKLFKYILVVFFLIAISFYILLNDVNSFTIGFKDNSLDLVDLLTEQIYRILTLTPHEGNIWGSILTRVNATIFSIIEYINSYGLGIGIGNTHIMLEKPEYTLNAAKSIHNLPLQLLVENGIIVLVLYIFILRYLFKLLFKTRLNKDEAIQFLSILFVSLGILSSSSGIHSNYFVIVVISYILNLNNKNKVTN